MNRSVSRKNGGRQQNVEVYEERGKGSAARGSYSRNVRVDNNGCSSYQGVMAEERVKVNKKSASARQTVHETSLYYSPEDSSTHTRQHLVSRQAVVTNYNNKPKQTIKTYNLCREQYDSPHESWSISQSKATVSNGNKTKVVEQRSFNNNPGRSIDYYGSSSNSRSSNNRAQSLDVYRANNDWGYDCERAYVDSHVNDVFSNMSLR